MPNTESNTLKAESKQEQVEREMQERRAAVAKAISETSQAGIDLVITTWLGDAEQRALPYWIESAFVQDYKYQQRNRVLAAERAAAVELKKNQELFDRYIAMNPIKSALELVTLMQRFNVCPQVNVPTEQVTKAA